MDRNAARVGISNEIAKLKQVRDKAGATAEEQQQAQAAIDALQNRRDDIDSAADAELVPLVNALIARLEEVRNRGGTDVVAALDVSITKLRSLTTAQGRAG